MACQRQKLLNPSEDSTWAETMLSFNLRAKDFGEASIWLKTSSGNTIDVMHFVHSVPIGEEHAFLSTLTDKIKYFLVSPVSGRQLSREGLLWITAKTFPRVGRVDLGGAVLKKAPQNRALPKKWCLKIRQRMS